jgi:hypothetical protein
VVPGAVTGGALLLLLLDNCSYTLFGFGVLTPEGVARVASVLHPRDVPAHGAAGRRCPPARVRCSELPLAGSGPSRRRVGHLFGLRHAIDVYAHVEEKQESPYWKDARRVGTLTRYLPSAPEPGFVHTHFLDT